MSSTGLQGIYSTAFRHAILLLLLLLVGQTATGVLIEPGSIVSISSLDAIYLDNATFTKLVFEFDNGTHVNAITVSKSNGSYVIDVTTSSGTLRLASLDRPTLRFFDNILYVNDYMVQLDFSTENTTLRVDGDASGAILAKATIAGVEIPLKEKVERVYDALKGFLLLVFTPVIEFLEWMAAVFGTVYSIILHVMNVISMAVSVFNKYIVEPGYLSIAVIIWIVSELVLYIAAIPRRGVTAIAEWFGVWASRFERIYYFFRSILDLLLKFIDLIIPG